MPWKATFVEAEDGRRARKRAPAGLLAAAGRAAGAEGTYGAGGTDSEWARPGLPNAGGLGLRLAPWQGVATIRRLLSWGLWGVVEGPGGVLYAAGPEGLARRGRRCQSSPRWARWPTIARSRGVGWRGGAAEAPILCRANRNDWRKETGLVSDESERTEGGLHVELKDPALAAFLAWLVPGLGHLYQRRMAKALVFFVCIVGTFAYGVYLGGSDRLGWGRVVYASWKPGHRRWHYLCQVCVGLPALPALVQAARARSGRPPLLNGFMAPPQPVERPEQYLFTLDTLHAELHRFFELGTVYTMVAGLLNVLAIYDAWGGPVVSETKRGEHGKRPGEGSEASEAA